MSNSPDFDGFFWWKSCKKYFSIFYYSREKSLVRADRARPGLQNVISRYSSEFCYQKIWSKTFWSFHGADLLTVDSVSSLKLTQCRLPKAFSDSAIRQLSAGMYMSNLWTYYRKVIQTASETRTIYRIWNLIFRRHLWRSACLTEWVWRGGFGGKPGFSHTLYTTGTFKFDLEEVMYKVVDIRRNHPPLFVWKNLCLSLKSSI
jgi:hypothetical protein